MTYRVKWSAEARAYRIHQRRPHGALVRYEELGWMNFGNEEAAHEYVALHGLPPQFRYTRVKPYLRIVQAA